MSTAPSTVRLGTLAAFCADRLGASFISGLS
jgi:hypothetical protein